MIEEIMDYCGVLPNETLMVGDTKYDLNMAHNAHAHSLAISHGAHDVDTLLACRPQAIVSNLFQVEQWLNKQD